MRSCTAGLLLCQPTTVARLTSAAVPNASFRRRLLRSRASRRDLRSASWSIQALYARVTRWDAVGGGPACRESLSASEDGPEALDLANDSQSNRRRLERGMGVSPMVFTTVPVVVPTCGATTGWQPVTPTGWKPNAHKVSLARLKGLEPPTSSSGGKRSIH